MLITYGALLSCERETGEDMLGSVRAVLAPSFSILVTLLTGSLSCAGASYSTEEVGERLGPRGAELAQEGLRQAYEASLPPPEPPVQTSAKTKQPLTWPELRAAAWIDLGLSAEALLSLTPLELHEMRRAHVRRLQHAELLSSQQTAEIINFSMRGPKERVKRDHFMLHPFADTDPDYDVTGEEILAEFERFERRNRS